MMDTTLFMGDIPAGTYAVGDIIPLAVKDGPAAVRNGYGKAILKEIVTGDVTSGGNFEFVIQNSNMIDPIINAPGDFMDIAAVDPLSTSVQHGHDFELAINSTWNAYIKCVKAVTTTAAESAAALIYIDYPEVASVSDPMIEAGIPTTLELVMPITINAVGNYAAAVWDTVNVDILKPDYKYLLEKISLMTAAGTGKAGFVKFCNAAAQNGLAHILPVANAAHTISMMNKYAAAMTKGPQDIKVMMFDATAGTDSATILLDYVKRRI